MKMLCASFLMNNSATTTTINPNPPFSSLNNQSFLITYNDDNDYIFETDNRRDDEFTSYEIIRFYCYRVLIPCVLCVGIVGNIITIVVLRRKRLQPHQHVFHPIGQTAASGFLCLAASDLGFCLVGCLSAYFPLYSSVAVSDGSVGSMLTLYYNNYKAPLLNIFLLTSTWLVIYISVIRYDAVSQPFHVNDKKCKNANNFIKVLILLSSVALNIPQFFRYRTSIEPCHGACVCYYRKPGPMYHLVWYHVVWHVLGTVLPLLILVYCNCRLLREIYRSKKLSATMQSGSNTRETFGSGTTTTTTTSSTSPRITLILVSIISLFLLLVCPSMILTFLSELFRDRSMTSLYPAFRTGIAITNLLQSVNFSLNFLLYSIISKHFRVTLIKTMRCNKKKQRNRNRPKQRQQQLEMDIL